MLEIWGHSFLVPPVYAYLTQMKQEFKSALSDPRAGCGPLEDFVHPSLGFRCSKSIIHTGNLFLF